ncbi:MAG: lipoate--protein ligase family protein [Coriobacteriia bacterium]|nr:lipoate--protein ligase family protein [Coriobacteriia bacterium]
MKWRLIIDGPVDGLRNMAIDRAVLHAHETGEAPPTLRLYRWRVPTVTLGKFQKASDADLELCERLGIDVVRRPTGGRGVLHDDEVTYSVVAGVREGLPRGVAASYRVLCGALVEAYHDLGVDADLTARPRGERAAGACYLHATSADLSLGAAKLSGSAQVWHRDSCLQHGSFVRTRDISREARVFRLDEAGEEALAARTVTFADVLAVSPDDETIRKAVSGAFERVVGIEFQPGVLSEAEAAAVEDGMAQFRIDGSTPRQVGKEPG